MYSTCGSTTFNLRIPHQSKKKGDSEKVLVLEFRVGSPPYFVGPWSFPDWVKVDAKLCDPESKQCETAASAAMRVDSISRNHKRAVGVYRVDFPSSGHQEGKFEATYHYHGPKIECL